MILSFNMKFFIIIIYMSIIDTFSDQLKQLILPKESEVKKICEKAKEIISKEPNLVHLNSPITVCGIVIGVVTLHQ